MTGLLLALIVNSFGSGTHGIRLVDAEELQSVGVKPLSEKQYMLRVREIEDGKPSLAAVLVPMSFAVLLGTGGSFALPFGVALLASAGGSSLSGLAIALGIVFTGIGVVVLSGGIICLVMALKAISARGAAAEEMEQLRSRPVAPPEIEAPVPPPVPTQVRGIPQHLITIAMF